jgi:SCP-2 sterol transfer family
MVTEAEQAFTELAARGHDPAMRRATGTVRVDLHEDSRTRHWYLDIDRGKVEISHREAPADAVMRADGDVFNDIVTGRRNAMSALLRNEITYEGDPGLLLSTRRLFSPNEVPGDGKPGNGGTEPAGPGRRGGAG